MVFPQQKSRKISKLHERALRLVYEDFVSSYEQLWEKDNSFSIHTQATQRLCIEIFKFLNGFPCADYMKEFINIKVAETLELKIPFVYSELKGKNSLRYFLEFFAYRT